MSQMKVYEDLSGNSGITGYRISDNDDSIDIEFRSGKTYTYTRQNVGYTNFEVMKALAKAGAGLCSFLTEIRGQYTPNATTNANRICEHHIEFG